jgi:hypothetical protein
MKFYPEDIAVPNRRITDEFIFRPLQAIDVELDYEAVIASRAKLLERTAGEWPKEGFTIEENLKDLEYHEQQHQDGNEFTFTIMNVSESECLGCIYIHPLVKRLKQAVDKEDLADLDIKDYEAWLAFWVTPKAEERGLDRRVVEELQSWFSEEWAFSKVALSFGPRPSPQDLQLVEDVGLKVRYSFQTANGSIIAWELHKSRYISFKA